MKIPFFKSRKSDVIQTPEDILNKMPLHVKSFFRDFNCGDVEAIEFQLKAGIVRPFLETYLRYYQSISPLGDAIDLISNQFSQIQPKIWDERNKEFVEGHPFLDLLKNPNTNVSYCEFAEREAAFFEITGNLYWIVTRSKLDGEPLELSVIPPQWVNPSIGKDGRVANYVYTPLGSSITFMRSDDQRTKNIRYFNEDGTQELFTLKRFNPNAESYWIVGISKLHSLNYQLAQFRAACVHNQSLLENSATPSGMFASKRMMTKDQEDTLRRELQTVFSGATNAGRALLGPDIEWTPFSVNNRDMDYATLKSQMKEEIYNRLKIPLALINSTALSLANMEVAALQLYDLNIFPLAARIFDSLTKFVLHTYKDSENLKLTFDPSTVPAVKDRSINQVSQMAALSVMSDNEIRNRIDLPDYDEGNQIYKPTNVISDGEVND